MPKKIKNAFDKSLTFEKMLQAHIRARKQKTYKNEVIKFELNLENNIINIIKNLKNGTYQVGNYYTFKIYEPKERMIQSLPYKDRVVHQWYVEEFIKPNIVPKFIKTSYACMENRGTHKAVDEVQRQMRIFKRNYGDFWILKCDIKKFFYSIDPYILYHIMKKYISDKKLLELTRIFIFNHDTGTKQIGIPIGNYTSQFFANIYLNELDQYIKRVLKIKYYTRYMDDFIILLKTKQECIETKAKIEEFLAVNLKLELNDKSRYYPYKMGVNFCGYRIFTTHRLLRLSSKKKMKRSVKKWNREYKNETFNFHKTLLSLNSWMAHSSHCNSYKLQTKVLNSCEFLWTDSTCKQVEKNLIQDMQIDSLLKI